MTWIIDDLAQTSLRVCPSFYSDLILVYAPDGVLAQSVLCEASSEVGSFQPVHHIARSQNSPRVFAFCPETGLIWFGPPVVTGVLMSFGTSCQLFDRQVQVESPMRLASPKKDRALSPEELLLAEKDWGIEAGSCIPTNVQLDLWSTIDLMG